MTATDELIQWALTQGGLAVVIMVVLWAYRKDLTRIQLRDQEKTEVLITLVRDVTIALQELKSLISLARK